ncbi:MAG: hypothetical protein P8J87_08735 [Verrucomicrobiales bacterium]|nr:hypothetical protein [Verrucomicrobiales bacterium]
MKTPRLFILAASRVSAAAVLLLITAGWLVPDAEAAPVPVNNFSFDEGIAGGWTNELPIDPPDDADWIGASGGNNGGAFLETIGGFAGEGADHLGTQNGYYVFQNTGVPWEANTKYTLTVGLGNRNDGQSPAGTETAIGLTVLNEEPSDFAALAGFDTDDQLIVDDLFAENALIVATDDTWTPNSTFKDAVVEYTTGDIPPVGNVVIFLGDMLTGGRSHFDNVRLDATATLDGDGDGLLDAWETQYGLSTAPGAGATGDDGADGNPDGDGLTNAQEFEKQTDPTKADTDSDGLDDHEEIATDPNDADSDDDRLSDGDEVNTYTTDPMIADSDGDGFEDFSEIAALNGGIGGDPKDGNSTPAAGGDLFVGVNFIGEGREAIDPRPGASVTGAAGLLPQSNWNNFAGGGGVPNSEISGPTSGYAPLVDSAGQATVIRLTKWKTDGPDLAGFDPPAAGSGNDELMWGLLRPRGGAGDGVSTEVTVSNIAYSMYDVYIYCDADTLDGSADYTINPGEGSEQTRFGVLDFDTWDSLAGSTFVEAAEDDSEGNVVIFRGVSGATLNVLVERESVAGNGGGLNGIQIVKSTADVDGDELIDTWESRFGLSFDVATGGQGDNGKDGDPDSDTRTNFQEQAEGTNPKEADTDGDGLRDDAEIVATTNPLRSDTDSDGRTDGEEVNGTPKTDPKNPDSDGDGFTDGAEVAIGTDPNNPNSVPALDVPIGYWSFDDQGAGGMTADLAGPNDGEVIGFMAPAFVAGRSGAADDFAIALDPFDEQAVITELSMDGLEEVTMAGWIRMIDNTGQLTSQGGRTGLFGQNDSNEMGFSADGTLAWWMTGGPGQIEYDVFDVDFLEWVHVAVVGDADGRRVYINGVDFAANQSNGTDAGIAFPQVSSGFLFNIGGGGIWDAAGNFFWGQMDDVAIWDVALPEGAIERLASGEINPLGQKPGGGGGGDGDGFVVTEITRDSVTGEVSVTFVSDAGVDYALDRRNPVTGEWSEIDDTTGAAGTTTFSGVDGSGADALFRVRKID